MAKRTYRTTYRNRRPSRRSPQKGSLWNRKTARWILLLLLLLTASIFFTGPNSVFKLYMLYQEREQLRKEKEALLKENRQLKETIKKLESDLEYIEKVAREKYNLKKKNEEIYLVKPE